MLNFLKTWLARVGCSKLVWVTFTDGQRGEQFELLAIDELGAVLYFEPLDQVIAYRWPGIASVVPIDAFTSIESATVRPGWFSAATHAQITN